MKHMVTGKNRCLKIAASVVALVFGLTLLSGCSNGSSTSGSSTSSGSTSTVLTGDKADLYAEIQYIRAGVSSGTLVFEWNPGPDSGLPQDPMLMLDSMEQTVLGPDVSIFLVLATLDADDLCAEIRAMPQVDKLVFVSKEEALERLKAQFEDNPEILANLEGNPLPAHIEVWLEDYSQAQSFAAQFEGLPEVDEAKFSTIDYAELAVFLRSLVHPLTPAQ